MDTIVSMRRVFRNVRAVATSPHAEEWVKEYKERTQNARGRYVYRRATVKIPGEYYPEKKTEPSPTMWGVPWTRWGKPHRLIVRDGFSGQSTTIIDAVTRRTLMTIWEEDGNSVDAPK